MIEFVEGDIFENSPDVWLINPVNCVGVMGAGLALDFKERFPKNYIHYKEVCRQKLLVPGVCMLYHPERIINFPTKNHWADPSKMKYIADGLHDMFKQIHIHTMREIACPALGCGLGGLVWRDVKELIKKTHDYWDNFNFSLTVYEPREAE